MPSGFWPFPSSSLYRSQLRWPAWGSFKHFSCANAVERQSNTSKFLLIYV